jgi:glycosidase
MGVNVLWLSSPVDAPDGKYIGVDKEYYTGYHGYWPTEMDKVEERLGDLNLLKQVVAEAHKQGIRVVMDYVMNHVHQNSPVFKQNNSWFWSLSYNGKSCVCGQGCSWETDPERLRCWFMPYLPDFNFQNASARQYSIGNAVKWIKDTGVDGYRLDAVKHIELSWLTDLRSKVNQAVGSKNKFYMVGETFTDSKGLLKTYIDPATKLDGQFDFPMRAELVRVILKREGSFNDLESFLNSNDGYYGPGAIMGTFLGNHDLPRAIHLAEDNPQFGNWDSGKSRAWYNLPSQPGYDKPYQRLAVGFTALMTLPGVPLIYYGDEVGLAGGGDPDNRRFMQWSNLSSDQTWLKSHVAKLGKIRASHPALRRGKRKQHWVANDVYAYSMTEGNDKIIVVLNRSDAQKSIFLPGTSYTDLLTGNKVSAKSVTIPPRSSLVLE